MPFVTLDTVPATILLSIVQPLERLFELPSQARDRRDRT